MVGGQEQAAVVIKIGVVEAPYAYLASSWAIHLPMPRGVYRFFWVRRVGVSRTSSPPK
jgi:hypothetical protein